MLYSVEFPHKTSKYSLLTETKTFLYLFEIGGLFILKVSKLTLKTWYQTKDYCRKTYKGYRFEHIKCLSLNSISC